VYSQGLGKPHALPKSKGGTLVILFIDQGAEDSLKSEGLSVIGKIGFISTLKGG
jgi:hypothetical protein